VAQLRWTGDACEKGRKHTESAVKANNGRSHLQKAASERAGANGIPGVLLRAGGRVSPARLAVALRA